MIVGREHDDIGRKVIFILSPSHNHMSNMKKENKNSNKNETTIYKFDEDSFDSQLNI